MLVDVDDIVEEGGRLDGVEDTGDKVVGIVELLGKVMLLNKA